MYGNYYPFGMQMEGMSYQDPLQASLNKYLYNGKELDTELGLNWYHYGFRMYDPVLGRFPSIDPIADQFVWVSPYNYAENGPISNIDLHGLQAYSVIRNEKGQPEHYVNSDRLQMPLPENAEIIGEPVEIDNSFGEAGANLITAFTPLDEINMFITGETASGGDATVKDYTEAIIFLGFGKRGKGAKNKPHGNSQKSTKSQHGYKIFNKKSGQTQEFGISGQKLNKNGTSPRVKSKLRTKYKNNPNYGGKVINKSIGNRLKALFWEIQQVIKHKMKTGAAPPNQKRPKVD